MSLFKSVYTSPKQPSVLTLAYTKSQTRLSGFTFTFHVHALEKAMAAHSSVLAWRIPGTGEPGGLPSVGSHRVGHDWSDSTAAAAYFPQAFPGGSDNTESAWNAGYLGSIPGLGRSPEEGNGYPLWCSCLENSMDRGVWWATVLEVRKSWTRPNDWHSSHTSPAFENNLRKCTELASFGKAFFKADNLFQGKWKFSTVSTS